LSPCGTSLLTNGISQELRNAVNRHSNVRSEQEVKKLSPEDHQRINDHISVVYEKMTTSDIGTAKKLSAELNGILSLYGGSIEDHKADFHQLLCTDTWLGEATASIVKEWLAKMGIVVELRRQKDLRTVDLLSFQAALSDLVQWCASEIEPWRATHHVVFNLTGGFKSIQGFLQTLAQFYADETIYIFESNSELLRLPRLPLRMAADDVVRQHIAAFRCLATGLDLSSDDTIGIPETLLMSVADWGRY